MKNRHHYAKSIGDLKQQLRETVGHDELKRLHAVRPGRHFLVLARVLALVGLCGWASWQSTHPWLWAPAAVLQGFNILGFIILLHEQVHDCIFRRKGSRLNALLGPLYGFPSGISASQFKVWHLDHHNELGSEVDDPKRAHLSPRKNARWFKLLYLTPVLFVIYAMGASREVASYPAELRRRIKLERLVNMLGHLALVTTIASLGGGWVLLRVYVIPLFFVFPVAFVLNRLGQHFDIDPDDPAKWSSMVSGNRAWHFLFLWSNFHMEHHWYPRVPFYNLPRLHHRLQPFIRRRGIRDHSYVQLVWGWFGRNKKPHTDWSADDGDPAPGASRSPVA